MTSIGPLPRIIRCSTAAVRIIVGTRRTVSAYGTVTRSAPAGRRPPKPSGHFHSFMKKPGLDTVSFRKGCKQCAPSRVGFPSRRGPCRLTHIRAKALRGELGRDRESRGIRREPLPSEQVEAVRGRVQQEPAASPMRHSEADCTAHQAVQLSFERAVRCMPCTGPWPMRSQPHGSHRTAE